MNSLIMQMRLANQHDTIKQFGTKGTPLKECFQKKIPNKRLIAHIEFLFKEKYGNAKINEDELMDILETPIKNSKKQLTTRGYTIIE